MTVVDKKNYGVEDLLYLYLKKRPYEKIEFILGTLYGPNLQTMYKSVCETLEEYSHILFPNSVSDPRNNSNTSWFDLQSNNEFSINVKYNFESSANSRIRDLTSYAVTGINEFLIERNILNKAQILSYDEVRNQRFHRLSNQIKSFQAPTYDQLDILYLKYTYLFCMNLIEGANQVDNIFFVKFKESGECIIFQTKYSDKTFLHKSFIDDMNITFSKNTKSDPHKQTVKYFLKDKYIGFLELRSNKRAMLHLRYNQDHWENLSSLIKEYFI